MKRFLMAALATLLLVGVADAATVKQTTPDKQTGGSSGDSSIVGADTTDPVALGKKLADLYIVAWSDSASIYTTQISPNGGVNWFTVDVDSVGPGAMEATASLGKTYADMAVRVILDKIPATGSGKSRAVIQEFLD